MALRREGERKANARIKQRIDEWWCEFACARREATAIGAIGGCVLLRTGGGGGGGGGVGGGVGVVVGGGVGVGIGVVVGVGVGVGRAVA